MNRYGEQASPFGFESLEAYKKARSLRHRVYKLTTLLPEHEKFGLVGQMRRAAVSLTNNIAEGYGRRNWQDNSRFCRISVGSLMELVDDINTCADEQYAQQEHLDNLKEDAAEVLRLLNGYINYLKESKKAH